MAKTSKSKGPEIGKDTIDSAKQLSGLYKNIAGSASATQNILGTSNKLLQSNANALAYTVQSAYELRDSIGAVTDLTSDFKTYSSLAFKNMQVGTALVSDAISEMVSKLFSSLRQSDNINDVQKQINVNVLNNVKLEKLIQKEAKVIYDKHNEDLKILQETKKSYADSYKTLVNTRKEQREYLKLLTDEETSLQNRIDTLKSGSERTKLINELEGIRREIANETNNLLTTENSIRSNIQDRIKATKDIQLLGLETEESIRKNIYDSIQGSLDSAIKLTAVHDKLKSSIENINTMQVSNATVMSKYANMEYQKAIDQFKVENKLVGVSDEQVNLAYLQLKSKQGLASAEAERTKLLQQTDSTGKKIYNTESAEVKLLDQIIDQFEEQNVQLDDSIKKLGIVEKYEKHIAHELEKQKIQQTAIKSISEKFRESLGEAGEEVLEIGHAIKESMVSPMALFGALIGMALGELSKITKTSKEFLGTTGLTVEQSEHLRHYAHELSLELRNQGVEMKNVLDAQAALLNEYGSINRVTDETTRKIVELGKAFGVSAGNAAGVVYQIEKSTGASAETAANIAALGADFARLSGIAPDAVMKDIAESSDQIAQYFKGTPADLMRTAVEARRLGLNLAKVADISKALLDFESSIENQMTASVLLGREINLDKARQLAMEGKIQEAAEETLRQLGSIEEFNQMNAVQKKAIADAAGMTVSDLQQSLEKQKALSDMTAQQRAEYEEGLRALGEGNQMSAERLLKEQRNQLVQEKLQASLAKIAEIFANVILPVLEPIFGALSGIAGVIGWMGPGIMVVVRGLLLVRGLMFGVQLAAKLLSFKNATRELGLMGGLLKQIKALGSGIWKGLMNITGITSAKKAIDALRVSKLADNVVTNTNTTSITANAVALKGKQAADAASKAATLGKLAIVRADTVATNLNSKSVLTNTTALKGKRAADVASKAASLGKLAITRSDTAATVLNSNSVLFNTTALKGKKAADVASKTATLAKTVITNADTIGTNTNTISQTNNAVSQSKLGKVIQSVSKVLGLSTFIKNLNTGATERNTLSNVKNALAQTKLGSIINSIGKVFGLNILAKNADAAASLTQASAAKSGAASNMLAGKAAKSSASGFLTLGAALLLIGGGIYLAATGLAELVKSFKDLGPEQSRAAADAILYLGVSLAAISVIMGILAYTGVLEAAALGFLAFGGAVLMVGIGIGIAAAGFSLLVTSVASASDELIKLIKNVEVGQLLAIAGGLTAIGLALSTIATFGMMALPALGAIAAISLGAGMVAGAIGGGGETGPGGGGMSGGGGAGGSYESEETTRQSELLQTIVDRLDTLTTAITSAGEIKLDAKKVGEVLAINTVRNYKIST